jgi:RND superfamily putative drug exporter
MTLLGRANWWFPGWLDRVVPNFSIEGEEWFRARDEAAQAPSEAGPAVGTGRVADDTVPT